jgi:ribosomal protein S18 acetylase RimI-like enzyme
MEEAARIIGGDAMGKFAAVMEFLEPFHERDAPVDHWYLAVIGVDSSHQGQGLGCAMMEPVLQKADEAGIACYLETAQPKNVAFYQRRGFDVLIDTVDPTSGLRLWTFRREPNPPDRRA